TRGWASDSMNTALRRQAEADRLQQEIQLLREETRIKDTRMQHIDPKKRPHYPPTERLAILELRAARGWSLAQTARTFLVTPLTIASWTTRLDEEGPDALVRLPEPVNRFPEFVAYLVKRLKVLCPTMGKVKIAQILARAGLHLAPTTVRRMLRETRRPRPSEPVAAASRTITARKPNDLWHVDLTTVPTALGFWVPWLPFALPQVWPFCWWMSLAIDHSSRRVMGFAVFRGQPKSAAVRGFLECLVQGSGQPPRYLVTDQGRQFVAREFKRWCRRRGIRQRFGAVGKYGSLAVIERCIRTLKNECTRRLIVVPYRLVDFENELELYVSWYNAHRPHSRLCGATPDEFYHRRRPAVRAPRFEPRPRWPRRSPCASPQTIVRGQPGVKFDPVVRYQGGRRHLPIITLKRAA
ncbi:MAG: DDE-type integrase/transposase/recombinase, partial [Vicinamibacteria bacterium]